MGEGFPQVVRDFSDKNIRFVNEIPGWPLETDYSSPRPKWALSRPAHQGEHSNEEDEARMTNFTIQKLSACPSIITKHARHPPTMNVLNS